MQYDTVARASEALSLNIEDLDRANKEAVIIGKGGNAERISWASLTARLLARVITRRTSGPLFIGDRQPEPQPKPTSAPHRPSPTVLPPSRTALRQRAGQVPGLNHLRSSLSVISRPILRRIVLGSRAVRLRSLDGRALPGVGRPRLEPAVLRQLAQRW